MYKTRKERLEYAKQYRALNKERLNKEGRDRYHKTIEYQKERSKYYYQNNKNRVRRKSKKNYVNNKKVVCDRAIKWRKNNIFKARISMILTGIKARCNNPKSISYKRYGKRGIKCYLNFKEIVFLWERDNGHKLNRPSIDRIDNNGPYAIRNCRFIELSDNIKRRYYSDKSLAL